jgi:hypothetical protein
MTMEDRAGKEWWELLGPCFPVEDGNPFDHHCAIKHLLFHLPVPLSASEPSIVVSTTMTVAKAWKVDFAIISHLSRGPIGPLNRRLPNLYGTGR